MSVSKFHFYLGSSHRFIGVSFLPKILHYSSISKSFVNVKFSIIPRNAVFFLLCLYLDNTFHKSMLYVFSLFCSKLAHIYVHDSFVIFLNLIFQRTKTEVLRFPFLYLVSFISLNYFWSSFFGP